jgi:hypothetical protein
MINNNESSTAPPRANSEKSTAVDSGSRFKLSSPISNVQSYKKLSTTLSAMVIDDNLRTIDDEEEEVGNGSSETLSERPSRTCHIALSVMDATLLNSHLEYKNHDIDVVDPCLSQGAVGEGCDVDADEVDVGGSSDASALLVDHETSLVDTPSKYCHKHESNYRMDLLLDSISDLNHIPTDEYSLSEGDIESDYESDDDSSSSVLSELSENPYTVQTIGDYPQPRSNWSRVIGTQQLTTPRRT